MKEGCRAACGALVWLGAYPRPAEWCGQSGGPYNGFASLFRFQVGEMTGGGLNCACARSGGLDPSSIPDKILKPVFLA